jgi:NitT/TauT family transport system substrate-binding protein
MRPTVFLNRLGGMALLVLCLIAALPVTSSAQDQQASQTTKPLRLASVKFGSLSWLIETVKAEGLDKKHGLNVSVVEIATNQASAVSLYGGNADMVVSDWTWALRQRGMGEALKFSPFSSALGSIMVPEGSSIKTLADLKGKKLGVAGSSLDKSWILLRAYSSKVLGTDISTLAETQFGAAPLLTEQVRDGKLDAVLNFWTFAARLKGSGFRPILTMSDVMKELSIDPQPALVGFVWKEGAEIEKNGTVAAWLKASSEANAILEKSDDAWLRLRPRMNAANDAEFEALKAGYRSGIPGPWRDAEMKSAEKIMGILVEGGDNELVGNGTRFDTKLFHAPGV